MTVTIDPHTTSSVDECVLIPLEKNHHENGNLTVVESMRQIPFDINRVYYLYDVPGDAERGGHSHRALQQFIVAVSGCFDVVIDDGVKQRRITLNRPYKGLLIRQGIWRVLDNFSSGAVCMVVASEHYDEADYVRDYDTFLSLTASKRR